MVNQPLPKEDILKRIAVAAVNRGTGGIER